jgi:hypothetical protein
MGQKLSPPELALYRAVDEVLHYVWDPIGVSSAPQARDEYQAYLPLVFDMVRKGDPASDIARHLSTITTEQMGLSEDHEHDLKVAHLLLEWKAVIRDASI